MNEGVVYLAIGEDHVREAVLSAQSLKQQMPDLPAILYTDVPGDLAGFDRVQRIECDAYDRSYNIRMFVDSPFERTLYLDSDTFIAGDLQDAFGLLGRFDFCAVHAPQHIPPFRVDGAPASFPQYNGGVVFLRRNSTTDRFLTRWGELYRQDMEAGSAKLYPGGKVQRRFVHCQPALRQALYETDTLRIATLPPEYNCRLARPAALMEPARILHGTYPDMAGLAQAINARTGPRLVYMRGSKVVVRPKPLFARLLEYVTP
jgi:hypothetical protein